MHLSLVPIEQNRRMHVAALSADSHSANVVCRRGVMFTVTASSHRDQRLEIGDQVVISAFRIPDKTQIFPELWVNPWSHRDTSDLPATSAGNAVGKLTVLASEGEPPIAQIDLWLSDEALGDFGTMVACDAPLVITVEFDTSYEGCPLSYGWEPDGSSKKIDLTNATKTVFGNVQVAIPIASVNINQRFQTQQEPKSEPEHDASERPGREDEDAEQRRRISTSLDALLKKATEIETHLSTLVWAAYAVAGLVILGAYLGHR